jgi:uncharacterized protein YjiS (DUF1127 family)
MSLTNRLRNIPMSDLTLSRFTTGRQTTGRTGATSLIAALRLSVRAHLTRQALPELSARELSDIGLTRHGALTEAARLPWDTNPNPRGRGPKGVFGDLQRAWHRARTRRLLAEMNPHELRDIGVTPTDAETEANKPFWRA